jgi:hypothetical protein
MYQEYNWLNAVIAVLNYNTNKMKITTEYEGALIETPLEDLIDFLCNMAEIANSLADFILKVEYGVTDETSRLSDEDRATLTNWYLQKKCIIVSDDAVE